MLHKAKWFFQNVKIRDILRYFENTLLVVGTIKTKTSKSTIKLKSIAAGSTHFEIEVLK